MFKLLPFPLINDISGFSAAILKEVKKSTCSLFLTFFHSSDIVGVPKVSERKEIFFATYSGHKSIILKQTLPFCY